MMAMYHVDPFGLAWIELEHSGDVDAVGGQQYRRLRHEWGQCPMARHLPAREWIRSMLWQEREAIQAAYLGEVDP